LGKIAVASLFRGRACYTAVAAFLAASIASQADASEPAYVSKVEGKGVTLSRGQEKLPLQVQTLLSSGDRVTAAAGSFVEVTYLEDGCILKAANGRSITISGASPCGAAEVPRSLEETQALRATAGQSEAVIEPAAADAVPAEVSEVTGPLARANLGKGLVSIKAGQRLNEGDTVFAGQDSTVTLYFIDPKCYYTLQPETYLQITADPPCRDAAPPPEAGNVGAAAALGAVALGGGAAALIILTGDDDDDNDDGQTSVTPN
jgi:hypothetical protein